MMDYPTSVWTAKATINDTSAAIPHALAVLGCDFLSAKKTTKPTMGQQMERISKAILIFSLSLPALSFT